MRKVTNIYHAVPASDGDGVKIQRIGGQELQRVLDPFLMIDIFNTDKASDYIGGFPEHPHRGFETITYMKTGRMRHRDHMGNEGVIGTGDVQWMTAGSGVLHSEMPEQEEGLMQGFQLWLNLPAAEKMVPAAYEDIKADDIPKHVTKTGSQLNIISGEVRIGEENISGAMPARTTKPVFIDSILTSNDQINLAFNPTESAVVYVYEGEVKVSDTTVTQGQLAVLTTSEQLVLSTAEISAKFIILSGKSLNEPIAQYGPFVMNTKEQIEQAISDYRTGRLVQ